MRTFRIFYAMGLVKGVIKRYSPYISFQTIEKNFCIGYNKIYYENLPNILCDGVLRWGLAKGSCDGVLPRVLRRGPAMGSCEGVLRRGLAMGSCDGVLRWGLAMGSCEGSCDGVLRRGHKEILTIIFLFDHRKKFYIGSRKIFESVFK